MAVIVCCIFGSLPFSRLYLVSLGTGPASLNSAAKSADNRLLFLNVSRPCFATAWSR